MFKYILMLLLVNAPLFAQSILPQQEKLVTGFDPRRDIISDKYVAGPYLIYDCQDKHWVCVEESFFEECRTMREEDKRQKKTFARCAPVGEFEVKFSCFQEQLRLTGNVDPEKLCVLDNWKRKQISFE